MATGAVQNRVAVDAGKHLVDTCQTEFTQRRDK